MTPNEKAQELINKFFLPLDTAINTDMVGKRKLLAKKHALLCVDEIISTCPQKENEVFGVSKGTEYWQNVKSEIEKL